MTETDAPRLLVIGSIALFWIGMLGLLWRRSLLGMLVGLLFSWIAIATGGVAFSLLHHDLGSETQGSLLVLCAALAGCLQIAVGLALVVARIERRGTLDADDAGLLEG